MKQDWKSLLTSTCIIIPAFNEAESITTVISQLRTLSKKIAIIVVNDGSSDATGQTAENAGATVINLPFNLGIGGAVQTGLKYAQQQGFIRAIQVDADGQHPPQEIKKLLAVYTNDTDLIIGSRFIAETNYAGLPGRNTAIRSLSMMIRILFGKKIFDPTSGFRLYGQRAIRLFAQTYPVDFPEPESVVHALNQHFIIKEVSVQMKKREKGQTSIRSIKGFYLVAAILLSIFISIFQKGKKYDSAT